MVRLVGDGGTFCAVVGLCVLPLHHIVGKLEKHNNNNEDGTASNNCSKTTAPTPALATSSLGVIAAIAAGSNHGNSSTSGKKSSASATSLATVVTTNKYSYNYGKHTSNITKKTAENMLEKLLLQELREYITVHIPKTCYIIIITSNRSRRVYEEFGFVHQNMVNQFGMFLKK